MENIQREMDYEKDDNEQFRQELNEMIKFLEQTRHCNHVGRFMSDLKELDEGLNEVTKIYTETKLLRGLAPPLTPPYPSAGSPALITWGSKPLYV